MGIWICPMPLENSSVGTVTKKIGCYNKRFGFWTMLKQIFDEQRDLNKGENSNWDATHADDIWSIWER